MDTNNKPRLWPRDTEDPSVTQRLGEFSSIISQATRFGTRIFDWCEAAASDAKENMPPFMLFRNQLDLQDAISFLVRVGSADPCIPLLRSIFEVSMQLEYMLKEDVEARAVSYLICYYETLKKQYQKFDPRTKHGRRFREMIRRDKLLRRFYHPLEIDTTESVGKFNSTLNTPVYRPALDELRRRRKQQHGSIQWYSFYGGPRSIYELANHLEHPAMYDQLYRQWSDNVHGTDVISGRVTRSLDSQTYIYQIRLPREIQNVVSNTISMALGTYQVMVGSYVPEQKALFKNWYRRFLREHVIRLSSKTLFTRK